MSIELLTILLFLTIIILFAMGAPVGFAMGGIAMAFGYFTWGPQCFKLIQPTIMNTMSGFVLLAIPLFIFMGQILLQAKIGEFMFHSFHVIAGRLRGGLAVGVIIICSMISAMVGIIAAGIMTAGTVALPPMLKRGYNRHLALGSIMAGGGMGILIPPSIPMIIFASITTTSIGKMFAAGLIPGLIMAGLFIVYIVIRCWINPELGPPLPSEERSGRKEKLLAIRESIVALSLIILVLGCILSGAATTTEAAAVGAFGSILVALLYRTLDWDVLKNSSMEALKLTTIAVWIYFGASVFNNYLMLMGAGRLVRELFTGIGVGPWGVIILMQISMIFMGFIMDDFVMLLLCAPIYTPIVVSLGFDPIWFGILMILQLEIAIQTPPYGFSLFYMKAVAPDNVSMLDIYKSITPFLIIKLLVLALCMAFPGIVIWLPNLLFK